MISFASYTTSFDQAHLYSPFLLQLTECKKIVTTNNLMIVYLYQVLSVVFWPRYGGYPKLIVISLYYDILGCRPSFSLELCGFDTSDVNCFVRDGKRLLIHQKLECGKKFIILIFEFMNIFLNSIHSTIVQYCTYRRDYTVNFLSSLIPHRL